MTKISTYKLGFATHRPTKADSTSQAATIGTKYVIIYDRNLSQISLKRIHAKYHFNPALDHVHQSKCSPNTLP